MTKMPFGQCLHTSCSRCTESERLMAHLLLIDDDPAVIPEQVRQTFSRPHRVEVKSTGAAGIEHVRTNPPDVILLDLRLPDGSGLEIFEKIRALDARIPVIFVTMAKTADTAI